jgi:hypothetical protein
MSHLAYKCSKYRSDGMGAQGSKYPLELPVSSNRCYRFRSNRQHNQCSLCIVASLLLVFSKKRSRHQVANEAGSIDLL